MSPTLDALVARSAPITDEELQALALDPWEDELGLAIMVARDRSRDRSRRLAPAPRLRIAAGLALALCAALVLAGTSLLGEHGVTQRAWGAEALRVANAVPRLLIGDPGWNVVRADEFTVGTGEMTFAGPAGQRVELRWNKASGIARLTKDRANSADISATSTVLGHRARVFRYAGTTDDFTALWRQDGYVLELRGGSGAATLAGFEALLHGLRPARVDEWLSAMPASVVLPVDHDAAVRRMLAGIPLPAGLDRGRLVARDSLRDRYQLGAAVTSAVACGWIGQWARARRDGDAAAAAQAVAAMRTSHNWAILRELAPQGHWSQEVWMYADAIAGPGTVVGGKLLPVEESYEDALGCGQGA